MVQDPPGRLVVDLLPYDGQAGHRDRPGRLVIALPFFVRRTSCPSPLGPAGFEPERALGVAHRWRRI